MTNPEAEIEKSAPGVDSSFLDDCPWGGIPTEIQNPTAGKHCLHFSIFDQKTKFLQ
jgi:hypothetical protein